MDVRARRGCARTIAVRGSSRANEDATGGWMKKAPLEKEKRRGGEQR